MQGFGHELRRYFAPCVTAMFACAFIPAIPAIPAPSAFAGGELSVVALTPAANNLTAPVAAAITVEFDQPVDQRSVTSNSFSAFGRWSGPVEGSYSFSNGDQNVSLHPDQPLFYGEQVMVVLSHDLQAKGGDALRSAGYCYRFWTAAMPADMELDAIDVLSTRAKGEGSTRAYGGIATDLDNDGWADITIVNEVSEDLRVFMNKADGSGLFHDFIQPTFPVNQQASPNEPSDFNHDGFADICVANIATSTVSILHGNGDGTFAPHQEITVGSQPRGVAVLDVDGDGDMDIANTNSGSGNISLLINDGNGVFGAPTFFDGGGSGEWGLAAADMNNDGIFDLVVGSQNSQSVTVLAGNGDTTFTQVGEANGVGQIWMMMVGDLNGDGNVDVSTSNGFSGSGSILMGNGDGTLSAPDVVDADFLTIATDLGDLDGDGDLDWVLSSFSGDWEIFTNDGDGNFTLVQEIEPPDAASCALLVDFDNDRDLDLVAIDENDDLVFLYQNSGITSLGDIDGNGSVGTGDLIELLGAWGPCDGVCPADLDGDGNVGTTDLILLLGNWG